MPQKKCLRARKHVELLAYLNVTPNCDIASKLDFHTRVTSQAFVAWSRQERKADIALPPTTRKLVLPHFAIRI